MKDIVGTLYIQILYAVAVGLLSELHFLVGGYKTTYNCINKKE